MPAELATRYNPADIEDKVYQFWLDRKLFHAEPGRPGASYTIVIPPPNVTAELHMGHALNNALQDIFIRYHRMKGFNTLWVPGTDHAGIATQNVVERNLSKEGLHRRDLGREKFIERVWQWKDEYGGRIIAQLKRLGCSCDWDRQRFTMDEGLSQAVLETFIRLHEKGLIYRGKYIVNWCPRCRTALSDIEVEHEEHEGHLWHIRYPLNDGAGSVTVATTRPETMLGDTAVAVHPDDERYVHLVGRTVTLPMVERQIPIVADERVDRAFGSGAVKVTPAHDPNDFEIGRRHGLEQVIVIDEDGNMTAAAGGRYEGMDRFECRQALVEDLRERDLLEKVEAHVHSVGHCYRCHSVVEPYLSEQWYVRMKPLAEPAARAARDGRITFHPARWKDFYLSWLDESRDWCISRQIWWGHRLPVYYCQQCGEAIVARRMPEKCPKCGGAELRQDEDVLDTWFSSALWPFSTLGWPQQTEDLKRYYPTVALVTARDIIYFWVARMVMMGLEFMGEVPFSHVVINATILDEIGRRMSKSLGNGIDPVEMIEQFGADAVRFSLVMLSTEGQDLKLSESRFEMGRNFANKVWNAGRFALINLAEHSAEAPFDRLTALSEAEGLEGKDLTALRTFEDRWILSRLQAAVEAVTTCLDDYRTHEAAQVIYDFVWHEVCDWYVEIVKPRLGPDAAPEDGAVARQTLARVLDEALRLLHPFAPYLTEELWQHLKATIGGSSLPAAAGMQAEGIICAPWPKLDPALREPALEEQMTALQDIVRAVRNVRKSKGLSDRTPVSVVISSPAAQADAVVGAHERFLTEMAVLSGLEHGVELPKPPRCATAVVGTTEVFLKLEGLVDIEEERSRLAKQRQDLEKQITAADKVTNDPNFLARAPQQVVDQKRERAAELRAQLTKVIQNLADLE
jgi:valyl-tRNA synthetase